MENMNVGIKLRRALLTVLYDKIGRLSIKSLTQTSSGKLISLISSDLFQIERVLGLATNLIAVPFINAFAMYLIVRDVGWVAMGVTLGVLVFQLIMQIFLAGI